jgi:histone deacetylase complex regulatory component SIN3
MLMNAPHPSATLTTAEPIKRAYEYLNQVRAQLLNNREVYDRFIEVMGRFKEQR